MRRWVPGVGVLAALLVAGCGGSSSKPTSTKAQLPISHGNGFTVGVVFDGPMLRPTIDLGAQMALARASGAQSVRISFSWAGGEPRPGTFAWGATDRVVLAAARHQLSLLPVVEYTPAWAGNGAANSPPRDPTTYGRFLAALIARYGPSGSLWRANPAVTAEPIRSWQIWNEPDFSHYWVPQPFAPSYVRLLAAAHRAVKAADPGAQVVLAGLPEFSWEYLAQILAVRGAASDFDVAAAHPYTAHPAGVITILDRDRAALDAGGAGDKPLLATEITWPSSQGKAPPQFGVGVTEAEQAQLIAQVMPLLAAARQQLKLEGFYWDTWMGDESPTPNPYGFNYAGLLAYRSGRIVAKPALAAFTRAVAPLER